MSFSKITLSLLLLVSPYAAYGVHARFIRTNDLSLSTEHRGSPDAIDMLIFKGKPVIPYNHVAVTPIALVAVKQDVFVTWQMIVVNAIEERLQELIEESNTTTTRTESSLVYAAQDRLIQQLDYLNNVIYQEINENLVAVPEQDVTMLMQWVREITVHGDEAAPIIQLVFDEDTYLTLVSCCGDLSAVVKDHIYCQKIIEAKWIAIDADPQGRIQPILHTSTLGEKFHFYKTRFGVYFRETLAFCEEAPGDLLRLVKYLDADPRYNASVHGGNGIIWLKFPNDPLYDNSIEGRYIPGKNAYTASWLYAYDLQTLYNELEN